MAISNDETINLVVSELNTIRRVLLNLRGLTLDDAVCANIIRSCITSLEQKFLAPLTIAATASTDEDGSNVA